MHHTRYEGRESLQPMGVWKLQKGERRFRLFIIMIRTDDEMSRNVCASQPLPRFLSRNIMADSGCYAVEPPVIYDA
jgi:hypothetical protein